ncbi:MAG: putative oxidoreductase [Chthonomonadaceae bacterium]|nr:putative oxidoreductase [Chthonomonadaceae bacterium]
MVSLAGKVRVGIIGPSWWVNYWHLAALQNNPHAEITAVCGAKARDEAETKAKYGENVQIFTDLETMLDTVPLDAVVVCTPNDLHHPATMAALRRGLHVICEKPLALDSAQAREMAETAKEKGLLGMANFPYRDNPNVKMFRRLVTEGYVGRILHVSGQYHGGFGLHRAPGWRGLTERSGSGILGDLGSHLIDLARYVTHDEFSAVCAHTMTVLHDVEGAKDGIELVRTEDPRTGVRNDDSCAFLAEFASGAQGIFHTSWVATQGAYAQHQEIEVYGTTGRLHFLANHSGTLLRGIPQGGKRWEVIAVEGVTHPDDAHNEEDYFRPGRLDDTGTTYRWIEAIAAGTPTISPDFEDGLRSQQVIDAVLKASAERRWIAVE